MKKISVLLVCLFIVAGTVTVQSVHAEETAKIEASQGDAAKALGVTAGVDFWNNYFWRGLDFFGSGTGVFFPWVFYKVGDTGLTAMYMGQYAAETFFDGTGNNDAAPGTGLIAYEGAHFNLSYSYTIDKVATVGVKGWYYWFYRSEDKLNYDQSWIEGTVFVTLLGIPLNPTISYTHDYYMDEDACVDGENSKDFYINLSVGKTIELVKGSTLSLGLAAGYFNYEAGGRKGFSDVVASAKLATVAGAASLYSQMNFAVVPDDDFSSNGDDMYRWWANFGVCYSF